MALFSTARSCLSVASFALSYDVSYRPTAIVARMRMIAMTIINSISVKPCDAPRPSRIVTHAVGLRLDFSGFAEFILQSPVRILCAIQRRRRRLREHVEDVCASPGRRIGIVLDRSHAPIFVSRHRIDRKLAKKVDPLILDSGER